MLVQTHFPRKLAPQRYDQYLASGWFRGSVMLYKVDLLCIESGIFGVVNIRMNLNHFALKKSQRKRLSRCDRRFTFSIGRAKPDAEKEALYALHKGRFKGFIHPTLNEYLTSGFHRTVFDTREICVYDGDKLVAVSYFDVGDRAMASLIGLQHPDYRKYGLGIYTMLKEVEFGHSAGLKWYYPGYVLDQPSDFDYKLDLGEFEFYTPTKRWGSYRNFDPTQTTGARVRHAIQEIREGLDACGIPSVERFYPYFSLGYMAPWQLEFLTMPHFFELAEIEGRRLLVGYEPVLQEYQLLDVGETDQFNHLVRHGPQRWIRTRQPLDGDVAGAAKSGFCETAPVPFGALGGQRLGTASGDGVSFGRVSELAGMKLGSWNVNGVRAVVKKDFESWLAGSGLDVLGLQETKAQDDQVREALFGLSGDWHVYSSSAVKKGYSGTAILSRTEPLKVTHGIGAAGMDEEGRVTTAEFEGFFFVTVYTPNSSSGLKRLPFRQEWDVAFREYLLELNARKPVVCCGDLNVAHQPIDLARPDANFNKTPGYTEQEIAGMTALLDAGFTDVWRHQNPETVQYSWWSYRGGAREKNVGWRLDYFLASSDALAHCGEADILTNVHGSDHCPVVLEWNG